MLNRDPQSNAVYIENYFRIASSVKELSDVISSEIDQLTSAEREGLERLKADLGNLETELEIYRKKKSGLYLVKVTFTLISFRKKIESR